jgi:hypothetical protein
MIIFIFAFAADIFAAASARCLPLRHYAAFAGHCRFHYAAADIDFLRRHYAAAAAGHYFLIAELLACCR